MKRHFNKKHFQLFLLLFLIEVLIAIYFHDNFIRPYLVVFLIVILIYCFLMRFLNVSKIKILVFVLVFSFLIEFSHHFTLVKVLGFQNLKLAKVILGNSFSINDLICFVLGIYNVFIIIKVNGKQKL